MLMAEIERTEHGDSGRARAWTLRAVRALHDPAWTADGYVSDRWRPVSPVSGRLDAFQWQTPVAALPSDRGDAIESSPFEEAMLAAPHKAVVLEPPTPVVVEPAPPVVAAAPAPAPAAAPAVSVGPAAAVPEPAAEQDNSPPPAIAAEPTPAELPPPNRPPLRRQRPRQPKTRRSGRHRCSGHGRTFQRPFQRRFRR